MDIKSILRNIKRKGIVQTAAIYKNRKEYHIRKEEYRKTLAYNDNQYRNRPFLKLDTTAAKRAYLDVLFEKELALQKENKKQLNRYKREMKELYVKERIPQMYAEYSKLPVQEKVIFMENGNSPSPSSSYIAKQIKKQGCYRVVYSGLKIRQISQIEYFENALEFIKELATAKAVFLSTANDLLSQFDVRPETKVIQLWHGVGVFKKVGYSTVDNKNFGLDLKTRMEYNQYRNYDYVTIAAEEQSWIFEEAMNIPKDSGVIVPVGVSRTDVFYQEEYIQRAYQKLYRNFPQIKGKKIILYAPTFRGAVADAQAPNELDINAFAKNLSDDYVLIIKHHGLSQNVPPIPEHLENVFAFDLGKNKVLSIEALLAIADICITDYSSIAFEYAIMERPILFFAYDLEDYIDQRGLYYPYDEITPGPVCRTNQEMIDYIVHIEERFDKQEILDFKQKYVGACDGHATERTIALIES